MKNSKYIRMVAGVAAMLFIVLAIVIVMRISAFTEGIAQYAATQASDALGVPVSIGGVEVTSFRTVHISDITIRDREQKMMLEAPSADVEVGLLSMLSSPVGSIRTVTVDAPKAILRERADGSFNIGDIRTSEEGNRDFTGEIVVNDASADIHLQTGDFLAERIGATIDFDDPKAPAVKAAFAVDEAEIELSGVYSAEEQTLRIRGENIDIQPYLAFLPDDFLLGDASLREGRLDSVDVELQRAGEDISLEGDAHLVNAKMRVLETDVEDVEAKAHFTGEEALLYVRGTAAEQTASAYGRIRYREQDPSFNFVVRSVSFDPGRVLTNLDYSGAASVLASLYGTVKNPVIDGDVEVAEGVARGIVFTDAKAHVHFEDSQLSVSRFSLNALDGKLEGMGGLSVEDQRYHVRLKAAGLDAAQLASLVGTEGVTGGLSADVMVHGRGADTNAVSAYGTAHGEGLAYRGVMTSSSASSFYIAKGSVHFDYLGFDFADGGSLAVEGEASRENLALSYYGSDMPLALVTTFVPQASAAGRLDVSGRIEGSTENPYVTADFQGREGVLFEQPFDRFTGRAAGSLDGVELTDFTAEKNGKITWYAKGSVGFVGERRVHIQLDTVGARMEDIMALVAPEQPLTGNVDNIITITGTLDNPSAVGYIHFYEGSYHGYFLTGMDGDYFIDDGVLRLQDFHIFSPLIDMDLNGTMKNGQLDMEVVARDIDLNRMSGHLPYPVEGHGVFLGRIMGTINDPHFDGMLTADRLLLNGAVITNAHGDLRYQDGVLRLSDWGFTQNAGLYSLDAAISLTNETVTGKLEVDDGDIAGLLSMANLKNDVLAGKLNGSIEMNGEWTNPDVKLTATLDEASVAGYGVTDAAMRLKFADRKLYIHELHARQGSGVLAATGTVPFDGGAMSAQFSSQGVAAGMLTKAFGSDLPVTGDIDLEMQFRGTVDNPIVDASLKITDGGVAGSSFDMLTGLFWLSDGKVRLNQLLVQKAVAEKIYTASAKGEVGVKTLLHGENWLDSNDPIDLHFMLDDADLSLLPVLSDEVEWALGPMDGRVDVRGTMASPQMDGYVGFNDGAVKLKHLERPFRDMQGRIAVDGNRVTLEDFRGSLGEGSYQGTGTARLSGGSVRDYHLDITADKLGIESSFYRGPLSAEMHVSEGDFYGQTLPKIQASANLENALISVPTIPDTDSELPHVILDLDVDMGRGVHFYSSQLYDIWLVGRAHFGGTTRYVSPSGSISVRKGNFTYNTKRFTIRDGEAYFNQVESFLPSISMHADTRVGKTRVYIELEGPLSAMDVRLTSSPEMSETEILKLLTFQTTDTSDMDVTASLLNFGLSMTLLSSIEDAMRNSLGIDEFRIAGEEADSRRRSNEDPDSGRVEYNVELGKYVGEKWMLRYKFGIGNDTQEYGVRYDMDDRFSLYTGRDEDAKANVFGLEARIRF
ncbi:hypothetical protein TAMA11512_06750 [Selenomonas sp. TAMA-11512]|uniref:translocation/assembly module TamB domain-containing protein n=1 Tax=Selenomonas sp. TAMA-11512 TaxID=3095337 RepID=UPI0030892E64|nr:hypothetical protein TAMA11512_06750 [Selenomonas sp. TAMA-11512]